MSGDRRVTRRAVLVAAVGIVVAACTKHRAAAPPEPARGTGPIAEALAAERALIAAYDAAAPPADGDARYLASLLAAHKEHLAALEQAAGIAPSATGSETATSSPTPAPTEGQLQAAETASARRLTHSAVAATDGAVAALLASIAATHQVYGTRRVVRFSSTVHVP